MADADVVREVDVFHDEASVADLRHVALARGAVHRDELAADDPVAEDGPRLFAAVAEVLRKPADDRVFVNHAARAHPRVIAYTRESAQLGAVAYLDFRVDDAVGAYLYVFA